MWQKYGRKPVIESWTINPAALSEIVSCASAATWLSTARFSNNTSFFSKYRTDGGFYIKSQAKESHQHYHIP